MSSTSPSCASRNSVASSAVPFRSGGVAVDECAERARHRVAADRARCDRRRSRLRNGVRNERYCSPGSSATIARAKRAYRPPPAGMQQAAARVSDARERLEYDRRAAARRCLRVAAEELVGTLAGERDRHMLGGELAERHEAERREVGERFVESPDEILELDRGLVHRELELMVVGSRTCSRNERRVAELALPVLDEADRERLDRVGHVSGHQGDEQARVDTAAQHRTERDVAHQPEADRLLEARE